MPWLFLAALVVVPVAIVAVSVWYLRTPTIREKYGLVGDYAVALAATAFGVFLGMWTSRRESGAVERRAAVSMLEKIGTDVTVFAEGLRLTYSQCGWTGPDSLDVGRMLKLAPIEPPETVDAALGAEPEPRRVLRRARYVSAANQESC